MITYGFMKQLDISFEKAVELVTRELKKEGFGVLISIDMKKKFKEKLDIDFKKYVILGACNPALAYKSISAEETIGLMLPCNVIVYEKENKTIVGIVKPTEAMAMIENEKLSGTAKIVEAKLKKVSDSLLRYKPKPKKIKQNGVNKCEHQRFGFTIFKELEVTIKKMGLTIPFSKDITILNDSYAVGNKLISNRMAIQPMEGCDGMADGKPGELTYRRYRRFAGGGAGLIWFEATAVVNEGRANPRQLYLSPDNQKEFENLLSETLKTAINKFGSDNKPYTVLQLTHSGRYSRPEHESKPIIALNNPYLDKRFSKRTAIRKISDEELKQLEDTFADAAIMAGEIGFDAVDIKSCHGYLISELLTARMREGDYGGSFENRTRFLKNVIDKIQSRTKGKLDITLRLTGYDALPFPYGWGIDRIDSHICDSEEPVRLASQLYKKGLKLINISAGNPYYNPHIGRPYDSGPYVPPEHPLVGIDRILNLSREIRQAVPGMTVMASGFSWLREFGALCAAGGVSEGWFDLAGFGRQVFAYPDFADDIVTNSAMKREKCCIACGKCTEIMRYGGKTGCVIRDAEVYSPIYKQVSKGK